MREQSCRTPKRRLAHERFSEAAREALGTQRDVGDSGPRHSLGARPLPFSPPPASWCRLLPAPPAAGTGSLPAGTRPRCVQAADVWTGKPPKEAERSHRGGLWMLTGPLFLQAQQPSPVPGQHGRPRGARGLPRLSCTRRRVGGWGTPGFLSLAQEPVPADSAMALLPGFQSTVALTTTPCSAHMHGVLHQPPGAYGETEGWGAVRGARGQKEAAFRPGPPGGAVLPAQYNLSGWAGSTAVERAFCPGDRRSFKQNGLIRSLGMEISFPGGTSDKEPACHWRRHGFDP